ncbi:MAG: hypothetical protein LUF34_00655, partial [Lachnospiraceae bacterium]|nr:hypothetical protein [Lachnospiraceae bacterium]
MRDILRRDMISEHGEYQIILSGANSLFDAFLESLFKSLFQSLLSSFFIAKINGEISQITHNI